MSTSQNTTDVANEHMVAYCFDTLINHYDATKLNTPTFTNDPYPLFVTWKIDARGNGDYDLRGCIGTFQAQPLIQTLNNYALTSALKDHRFKPIPQKDLPKLKCSVSLLVDFEDAKDCWDWEVGVHGIWIEFRDASNTKLNATYLPEVMPEQEWTKEEALKSLVRKAGYNGKVDEQLLQRIKLTRYQSSKSAMTYAQYLEHKKSQRQ
ncbi:hypothetical protein SAMD00019534_058340 [Acytostelium subglobosum LB1]|uniref:hypothetical protein n=1 Tax=Acytostelium subglobosum LB1 TaxID=1410327 RepID=UPI000644D1C8|nr:hypothetical protein SAMD00019534_058340 [Acytostelium subglobosum LB1]GAM22659.1 hypothetical protein SAMD00019534_058340 [Acytostelium subglobosum LB1]|eukprot:XP_012754779.1 hypothetical protein SAMD00019534_058340 [Acytostelium subglobosum LB1]